ncbi:hypothetical protein [Streptomyces sp. WAC06614]|uniref:hypothetical protein n=1 Tax=Streptomyces sp. WAC06614 TaxID=2487416 RepID=UPI00163C17E3|nr:hypothetical protein [Streptomyces sp. WAC06614]
MIGVIGVIGVIGGLIGVAAGHALHGLVMPVMGRAVGSVLPPAALDVYGPGTGEGVSARAGRRQVVVTWQV